MLITLLEFRYLLAIGLTIAVGLMLILWKKSFKKALFWAIVVGSLSIAVMEVILVILFSGYGP